MCELRQERVGQISIATKVALRMVARELGAEYADKGVFLRIYHMPPTLNTESSGLIDLFAGLIGGEKNSFPYAQCSHESSERSVRLAKCMKTFGPIGSWGTNTQAGLRVTFRGAVAVRCLTEELEPKPSYLMFSVSGLHKKINETVALLIPQLIPWKVVAGDIYQELLLAKNDLASRLVGAQTKGALKHYGYVGD